jgi:hypothetical protein
LPAWLVKINPGARSPTDKRFKSHLLKYLAYAWFKFFSK